MDGERRLPQCRRCLTAVDVRPNGSGLSIGAAQPLFHIDVDPVALLRNFYAAAGDGQKFLVLSPLVGSNASPLVGVLNWAAGLRGE